MKVSHPIYSFEGAILVAVVMFGFWLYLEMLIPDSKNKMMSKFRHPTLLAVVCLSLLLGSAIGTQFRTGHHPWIGGIVLCGGTALIYWGIGQPPQKGYLRAALVVLGYIVIVLFSTAASLH